MPQEGAFHRRDEMEELIKMLKELHDDVDYETHEGLIDDKIFNSFDVAMLIAMIGDNFDVRINPEDIVPANFNSAQSIWALIEQSEG